ncbi:single-stranded DNA-binding protein [Flaviflexus ciconiae]|uniref:Single-stranded DNA-binding protein n=1 Tax=Flaviflexus ciconiae TaxID=2496867 RepID=A0A3Q9G4S8_9ACTO|nr:single-stranded DNA-binding protein [Flaviflexus ciconiae]AZQ77651.1 single-stranded DNA-binding protein [Flaviflexus ciconiae]
MNEPTLTVTGNLTGDPELRYVASGIPVVNFTVAATPRTYNKQTQQWDDGEAMFIRCTAWREHAENIANSLSKGTRVLVTGRFSVRSYEHEGHKRTSLELQIDDIGPSLRYATTQVTRKSSQNQAQGAHAGQSGTSGIDAPLGGPQNDPWTTSNFDDTPPF